MFKGKLGLILKGAFAGFGLFCLFLIIFIVVLYTKQIFLGKYYNNEYYSSLLILPILVRIFYKKNDKDFLITTLLFYSLCFYLSMVYTCKPKDIFSFVQMNYKDITFFPLLTVLGYFLPDLISKITFLNKLKNIKLNLKINPIFLLTLQTVGLTYLIWYLLILFQFAFVNYIKYFKILNYFDVIEISIILSILLVLNNFIKKYKKPLNLYAKFQFCILSIIIGHYLPTIIFYFFPICPSSNHYTWINYFIFTPALILTKVFLYILIFNDIFNIKYSETAHKISLKTNILLYFFIAAVFLVSPVITYQVPLLVTNFWYVNILISYMPLFVIWGLVKLLYGNIKLEHILELNDDENQAASI